MSFHSRMKLRLKKATTTKYDYVICKNCRRTNGYLASEIAPGSGILVNSSVEFHVVPKRVKKLLIVNLVV